MKTLSYTAFRQNLAREMDSVNEDHIPLEITRKNHKSCIVMSKEDFESYEETAHLMKSANNAIRLNKAIEQLESGKGKKRDLLK